MKVQRYFCLRFFFRQLKSDFTVTVIIFIKASSFFIWSIDFFSKAKKFLVHRINYWTCKPVSLNSARGGSEFEPRPEKRDSSTF